jgi:phosphate starvation-inducible PhoH-like protein
LQSIQDFFDEASLETKKYKKTVKRGPNGSKSKKREETPQFIQFSLPNEVTPKTDNQRKVFDAYKKDYNLFLEGSPGTGKSFLALYLSLKTILSKKTEYKQLIIVRSAVSSRDIGFMPGSAKEKTKVFEAPYISICSELFGRADAYEVLTKQKVIEFQPTSFLRGTTFRDCIIILDEAQNLAMSEINTVLTRVGENCKVIICGDSFQDDLTSERYKEQSGFSRLKQILQKMESVYRVKFTIDDIVRSGFVREYIIAESEIGTN